MATTTTDEDASERARTRQRRVMAVWGAAFTALLLLVAVVDCVVASSPAPEPFVEFVLLLVWVVLCGCWLVWVLAEFVEARRSSSDARRWIWPVVAGLVVVAATLASVADLPLKARFAQSKAELSEFADTLLAADAEDDSRGRAEDPCVGSYCFDYAVATGSEVYFAVTTDEYGASSGFAYRPQGGPDRTSNDVDSLVQRFEPLGDGWYHYTEDWSGP